MSIAQKEVSVDWSREILKKYDSGASKHVYDIVIGDESWICAYEPEGKYQSTIRVLPGKPHPTKVVRAPSTSIQMVACFLEKLNISQ